MEGLDTAKRLQRTFPQTEWDLVEAAADMHSSTGALERILQTYLPFLEVYIVGQFCLPPERARDLLQSFVLDKVIEKGLLQSVDRHRGKFRNFLVKSLRNYVIQQLRQDKAEKRSPTNTAVWIDEVSESSFCKSNAATLDKFDVEWARGLLTETLRRMREECFAAGREDLWGVFDARLLRPLIEEAVPASYDDLIRQFGFESAVQASNALITGKRMFARQLRCLVAQYVKGEAAVQAEINELKEILLRAGAEPLSEPRSK